MSKATVHAFAQKPEKSTVVGSQSNIIAALRREVAKGYVLRLDTFWDRIINHHPELDKGAKAPIELRDTRTTELVALIETRYNITGVKPQTVRDAVRLLAYEQSFDSAIEWLESQQWDGKSRIDTFLPSVARTKDTAYTRHTSRMLWLSLASRVLYPGCQADGVLILRGAQGLRKTSLVKSLVWDRDSFDHHDYSVTNNAEIAKAMRGKVVRELGEIRKSNAKGHSIEYVKDFVTRTQESYRWLYSNDARVFKRRCVHIGTTNNDAFLSDSTGERRWFPVEVLSEIDVEAFVKDRSQYWAEAREIVKRNPNALRDAYVEANKLAAADREMVSEEIPFIDLVESYVNSPSTSLGVRGSFKASEVHDAIQKFREAYPNPRHYGLALQKIFATLGWRTEMVRGVRWYYRPDKVANSVEDLL